MMRHAQPTPAPPSLSGERAERERQAALAFFADPAHQNQPFRPGYSAYKSDDVRAALNDAFGYKCAYCESYFGSVHPVDVEHFRPKAEVVGTVVTNGVPTEVEIRPGYYWLASDWLNLLPSCIDCNRRRQQQLADGRRDAAGKGNYFPLRSEQGRAAHPGDERSEEPERLLLHPYLDDPADHLVYVDDFRGPRDGWVEPTIIADGGPSSKGAASISLYGLQRRTLVDARRAQLRMVRWVLADLEGLLSQPMPDGMTDTQRARLAEIFAELKYYQSPQRPYSAMCAQVIDATLQRLLGRSLGP